MTSLQNNTWSTFGVFPGSLFFALSHPIDEHKGPSFSTNLQQSQTIPSHELITHDKAIRKPTCMLPYAQLGTLKQQDIQNGEHYVLCW